MICHECRDGSHDECHHCPCQHRQLGELGVPSEALVRAAKQRVKDRLDGIVFHAIRHTEDGEIYCETESPGPRTDSALNQPAKTS